MNISFHFQHSPWDVKSVRGEEMMVFFTELHGTFIAAMQILLISNEVDTSEINVVMHFIVVAL